MVKVSLNRYVEFRVAKARGDVEATIQKLRLRTIKSLEEIFNVASKVVRGKIKHKRVQGKLTPISLSQREAWLRIAEQTAKTINAISQNFNEEETIKSLKELEKLIKSLEGEGPSSINRMQSQ